MLAVPYFKQNRDYTCGPVCLRMVLAYWGHEADEVSLSMLCGTNVLGTSAIQIVQAAQRLGFECDYKFKRPFSSVTHALQNSIPPIVSVDAAILYQRRQPVYTKHNIVLLEATRSKIICHDPEVDANLSAPPAIFKEAWERAKSEVIWIWPGEKTFTTKSRK